MTTVGCDDEEKDLRQMRGDPNRSATGLSRSTCWSACRLDQACKQTAAISRSEIGDPDTVVTK